MGLRGGGGLRVRVLGWWVRGEKGGGISGMGERGGGGSDGNGGG